MEDHIIAAHNMNHDLALTGKWAENCRMLFDSDPQKKAVELLFQGKELKSTNLIFLIAFQ